MKWLAALGVALLLCAGVAGCGDDDGTPAETTRLLVYLVRDHDLGVAAREVATDDPEQAALDQLFAGPTGPERQAELRTWIARGITGELVGLEDGVATVDLGGIGGDPTALDAMLGGGFGQIVFTLTQFPDVHGVRFLADGGPLHALRQGGAELGVQRRADWEEQTPQILVERPAVGDVVTSPLRLQGTANTFEATFEYEVVTPDGRKLAGTFVTATCGTGCRGTFDEQVAFDAGDATTIILVVFERSAEDGSRVNEVRIPLEVG